MARRTCKDCGSATRAAPHPGPRCATCHRERRKKLRLAQAARHLYTYYGMSLEQYDALYAAQGGTCAICKRATGARRRLAVDHDHACPNGCSGPISCGSCVRGLLCSTCNKTLGHFRDDQAAFQRAADYLANPPARSVLEWF